MDHGRLTAGGPSWCSYREPSFMLGWDFHCCWGHPCCCKQEVYQEGLARNHFFGVTLVPDLGWEDLTQVDHVSNYIKLLMFLPPLGLGLTQAHTTIASYSKHFSKLIYVYECLACMYICALKRASDPLELVLQMVVAATWCWEGNPGPL